MINNKDKSKYWAFDRAYRCGAYQMTDDIYRRVMHCNSIGEAKKILMAAWYITGANLRGNQDRHDKYHDHIKKGIDANLNRAHMQTYSDPLDEYERKGGLGYVP